MVKRCEIISLSAGSTSLSLFVIYYPQWRILINWTMETAVAHPVHINPMIEIIISFGGLLTALLDTCTAQLTYAPLLGDLLSEALQEWMYHIHPDTDFMVA